jgi:hypothetical protein
VVDCVSNGSKRTFKVSDPTLLYSAVKQNQYLSRLFITILYYLVSWSRLWADQSLNFDPSATRDDWVDITLPFYAGDGDLILTADVKLQVAVGKIERSGKVTAKAMI